MNLIDQAVTANLFTTEQLNELQAQVRVGNVQTAAETFTRAAAPMSSIPAWPTAVRAPATPPRGYVPAWPVNPTTVPAPENNDRLKQAREFDSLSQQQRARYRQKSWWDRMTGCCRRKRPEHQR